MRRAARRTEIVSKLCLIRSAVIWKAQGKVCGDGMCCAFVEMTGGLNIESCPERTHGPGRNLNTDVLP